LPPNAKVEIMGEHYVNAFRDREEIAGTIKTVGLKRAAFVRQSPGQSQPFSIQHF
jgi:hypothetical protein